MGISLKQADQFLSTFIEVTSETLSKGEKLQLAGFGTFGTHHVVARTGRNPKTGATVEVPAATYPHFHPGKILKEKVMPLVNTVKDAQRKTKETAKTTTNKTEKQTQTSSKSKSKAGPNTQPATTPEPEVTTN